MTALRSEFAGPAAGEFDKSKRNLRGQFTTESPFETSGDSDSNACFGMYPLAVLLDHRITLTQQRILLTLYSFASRSNLLVTVKRKIIAARCGLHESNVSKATTELKRLGWLSKVGAGGKKRPAHYTLAPFDVVAAPAMVSDGQKVAGECTVWIDTKNSQKVAAPAIRIEQSKPKGAHPSKKNVVPFPTSSLPNQREVFAELMRRCGSLDLGEVAA